MQRVNINGIETDQLTVTDRGFQYGDGLFETIACRNAALEFWNEHIARMKKGASALGISFPGEDNYFHDIMQLLTRKNGDCVVKLILSRGAGDRGYRQTQSMQPTRAVIISDWPDRPEELVKQGVHVCLCKHPVSTNPALAGIKHLNRLDNVLARNEWQNEYHEGFMLDVNGNIIEGTMSNIFCIKNGTLYTPELNHCGVNGIIRNQILSIAETIGLEAQIKTLGLDEINTMDEIFVTNSIIGIWPVNCIGTNKYPVGDVTGKLTKKLKQRGRVNAKTLT